MTANAMHTRLLRRGVGRSPNPMKKNNAGIDWRMNPRGGFGITQIRKGLSFLKQ